MQLQCVLWESFTVLEKYEEIWESELWAACVQISTALRAVSSLGES